MNLETIVRAVQRKLKIEADGKPGPQTWSAIHSAICGEQGAAEDTMQDAVSATVDARSERMIATLHPRVRSHARALILKAKSKGWNFVITSGLRTYAEQNALFAKRPKVTNAKAGFSLHNFGLAFDVTLFSGKTPVWESPLYSALGALGQDIGLGWGGAWKSFKDLPHFELSPSWAAGMSESQMLAELRRRKANNREFFA